MRIVALDPGGTTGVAYYERDGHPEDVGCEQLWSRDQLGPGEHHTELEHYLNDAQPEVVIYERFMYQRRELTKGATLNLDAVEYIGVVKLWHAWNQERVDLVCQTPHQAKKFWDDKKLHAVGLYVPGAPHANDATRHLLYYLLVNRGEREYWMKRLAPPS